MLWLGRLFDERYTWIRLTLVALAGVGYLLLAPDGSTMSTLDRRIAVGVLLYGYVGVWRPLAAVAGISAVLAAGNLVGADDDLVPTVALAWAVFELGARRSGRQAGLGLLLGLAGSLLSDYDELVVEPVTVTYAAVAPVIAPLLVGLHVRSLGELNRQVVEQELSRVRAEERTAIARELHDLVAHHVASIVLRVGVARNVLDLPDPRVRQVLDDVHTTGSGALADLRRLVAMLREPGPSLVDGTFVEPDGLPLALRAAVERGTLVGLDVEADIDAGVVRLDARTALAVLRLAQEGLANVAKHAGLAARAHLSVTVADDRVEFDLRDSGGSAPTDPVPGARNGLIGLRERVEVLGGVLDAGPDNGGWRLTARLPVS
jgi:signal transduction histidine kinase